MLVLALAVEQLLVQFGLGGGALMLLYVLLKPLVAMQLRLMMTFMNGMKELAQNNAGLLRTQADIGVIIQQFRSEMSVQNKQMIDELKLLKDKKLSCPMNDE